MSSIPPVHIVGAGLAGLTLARCLRRKGIQTIIYEKRPSPPRHSYGITLQVQIWSKLLGVVSINDGNAFCRHVAVDSEFGGSGLLPVGGGVAGKTPYASSSVRAHRGRLEALLREDLEIRWNHEFESISRSENGHTLEFKNEKPAVAELIVDTSGVHSQLRTTLSPASKLDVLPYVVFRGTRTIEKAKFEELYRPKFGNITVIRQKKGDALLQLWFSDYDKGSDQVNISYVYSRSAKEGDDSLYRPDRTTEEASGFNEAIREEISGLDGLEGPFKDAFYESRVRDDRLLHWLMRSSLMPLEHLRESGKKGVMFLGDSAHATPILGGEGANMAIEDALMLADYISESHLRDGGAGRFYEERYRDWEHEMKMSRDKLEQMHGTEVPGGKL